MRQVVARDGVPQVVVLSMGEYAALTAERPAGRRAALARILQTGDAILARRRGAALPSAADVIAEARAARDEDHDRWPDLHCASAVVRLLTGGAGSRAAERWLAWEAEGATLVAPTLLYNEVPNALRRYSAAGHVLPDEAARLADALALDVRLYGDAGLHGRALALAERFGAPLWTADRPAGAGGGAGGRAAD